MTWQLLSQQNWASFLHNRHSKRVDIVNHMGFLLNWDPRETSIFVLLLIYGRHLLSGHQGRAREAALIGGLTLAFVTVPILVFVVPRIPAAILHPSESVRSQARIHNGRPDDGAPCLAGRAHWSAGMGFSLRMRSARLLGTIPQRRRIKAVMATAIYVELHGGSNMGSSLGYLMRIDRAIRGWKTNEEDYLIMVIIAAFAAAGAFKALSRPTSHLAKLSSWQHSQVSGVADEETAYFDAADGTFNFSLIDKDGCSMHVEYVGTPPSNFDQAESVVVICKVQGATFKSEKILVKCPSKYQWGSES